ncbi:phage major capsid protein [Halalkalibacter kiskunsagensis]|uniref:Phage major capsid protein n=1 Tax=Halalkalibacter kiskunsagensis TaxID=1548599 RepID=A0ABV6K8D4_9BACI
MENQLNKMEIRTIDLELSGQTEESTGDLLVSGYVNKTGQWSEFLGREKRFKERIMPGTFNKALQKGNDVMFLAEHDSSKLLASTKNGSLTLREDEVGLHMEARISATSWGKDYHQLIKDGLLTNMSFGMRVADDDWKRNDDGTYNRTIKDIHLAEVSAVYSPAYVQSTIQARSIELVEAEPILIDEENQKTNRNEEPKMSKEKTLKELRAQMEALEKEVKEAETAPVEVAEVRAEQIDTETVETRGVEEFIKGNMSAPETRALTTGNQAITIPTHLSQTIVEKLVEQASLFSRAKGFSPVSGTLEVLREQNIGGATFIGEMTNAEMSEFEFDKIVLEQRRAATAIELSQQLVNDSGINIIDYSVGVLTRRLAREMDKSCLVGDKTNKQFEGILGSTEAEVVVEVVGDVVLDNLLDMTLAMHPDYLDSAVFVMGRQEFNKIAKLKDNDGNYHVVKDVVAGKPAYKIFGHQILIQDHMQDNAFGVRVAFVNFGEATASMIKKGASMKRISDDTTQALRGSHLIMLDIYADFKILNEEAIKFLKQA